MRPPLTGRRGEASASGVSAGTRKPLWGLLGGRVAVSDGEGEGYPYFAQRPVLGKASRTSAPQGRASITRGPEGGQCPRRCSGRASGDRLRGHGGGWHCNTRTNRPAHGRQAALRARPLIRSVSVLKRNATARPGSPRSKAFRRLERCSSKGRVRLESHLSGRHRDDITGPLGPSTSSQGPGCRPRATA